MEYVLIVQQCMTVFNFIDGGDSLEKGLLHVKYHISSCAEILLKNSLHGHICAHRDKNTCLFNMPFIETQWGVFLKLE